MFLLHDSHGQVVVEEALVIDASNEANLRLVHPFSNVVGMDLNPCFFPTSVVVSTTLHNETEQLEKSSASGYDELVYYCSAIIEGQIMLSPLSFFSRTCHSLPSGLRSALPQA